MIAMIAASQIEKNVVRKIGRKERLERMNVGEEEVKEKFR